MLNRVVVLATTKTAAEAVLFLGQIQQLKDGFGLALAVLLMFGFFWGIIKIWSGANAISKGDPDGKAGIIAGIIIAGAVSIMTALFAIFGLNDAVVTPRF
jgi:hypothetical protein